MNNKLGFTEWFESNFSSPKAVLVEYLPEIKDMAASIGASLSNDFIAKISISNHSKNFQYIPSIKGINDSKQSAYARLGKTNLGKESVSVPIVVFTSFKLKNGEAIFSPSAYLIRDFLSKKKVFSYNDKNIGQKYSDKIKELEINAEKNAKANQVLKEEANTAAAQLSSGQLREGFVQIVEDPEYYFDVKGLAINVRTEFICARSAKDMLYYQNDKRWKSSYSASPRNLIIPMYDIVDGTLQNLQRINVKHWNNQVTSTKRFLAGGRLINQCTFISEKIDSNCFIVTEGYKTGRVVEHSSIGTVIAAFSSNNVPNIVRELRRRCPKAIIFTATDNDLDGITYQKKAEKESLSIPIPAPSLFDGADWADLAKAIGIESTAERLQKIVADLKENKIV
ncbi:MAG: hypothetical protein V7749_00640 [Cocleimonas sp.]